MSDPRPPYEPYDPRLRPQAPGQSGAAPGWDAQGWRAQGTPQGQVPQGWGPQNWASQGTPQAQYPQGQYPQGSQGQYAQGWGPQGQPPQAQPGQAPLGWTPASADISQYAAPRVRTSTVVVIVAALALVGVLFAGVFLRRPDSPTATPTSASPTSSVSAAGMPFTMPSDPDSTGRWEILGREWSTAGVSVHVRISAASGTISYAFQAYGKSSQDATAPTRGGRQPELSTGILSAGEVADGYVFLELDRGDSTLFLTTRSGRAISALPITA